MSSTGDFARALDRGARRLQPKRWRQFWKRILLRLLNARKELPPLLSAHTGVVTLIAQSKEGLVAFDVRDQGVGWPIAFAGEWEREESNQLRRLVQSGDVVIDVGANVGWYTLLFSALVGDAGVVLAFEPDRRNFELLSETVRLNQRGSRVRAHQLALLAQDGVAEFELSEQNFGDHRIRFQSPGAWQEQELYAEGSRRVTTVAGRSLDSVLQASDLGDRRIKLMKIDCQGAEPAVVDGATRTLARTAFLAMEYWPYGIRRAGFDPQTLIRTLSRNFDSFALFREADARSSFQPISALEGHAQSVRDHANYLFRNSALA